MEAPREGLGGARVARRWTRTTRALASGIFETANHLFGGAVGVAVYATVMNVAASAAEPAGSRAAFLAATGLALLGLVAAFGARRRAAAATV